MGTVTFIQAPTLSYPGPCLAPWSTTANPTHGARMAAFIPLSRSAPRPFLTFLRWKTSASSRIEENSTRWQDDVENTALWLELLRPFAAVNLYLCEKFVPRVAPALQELVGARTTKVFAHFTFFSLWRSRNLA
jgi:hypothetical protein